MNKYLLEYDQQPDAAYMPIDRKNISRTIEIDSTIIIDLDKDGKIVGTLLV